MSGGAFALLASPGFRQGSEWQVLQDTLADYQQPLVFNPRRDGIQKHPGGPCRSGQIGLIGLADASGSRCGCLPWRLLVPRRQRVVQAPHRGFDFCTRSQFEHVHRGRRHRPDEAFLRAQRIFEQDSVVIQDLRLNLAQLERHRMCQCRVLRTGFTNPALDLLEFGG